MTGMIDKKDAKREYYQVKEAKRKVWGKLRKAKQSARHDERSAKCRVSGLEKTKLIEFVRKAFTTWSREGKLLLPFVW